MSFSRDPLKQASEVICWKSVTLHPNLICSNNILNQTHSQNYVRLIIDEKLNFKEHIDLKLSKTKRGTKQC